MEPILVLPNNYTDDGNELQVSKHSYKIIHSFLKILKNLVNSRKNVLTHVGIT